MNILEMLEDIVDAIDLKYYDYNKLIPIEKKKELAKKYSLTEKEIFDITEYMYQMRSSW